MSTIGPRHARSASSCIPVDPVEAHDVAEAFFDALGHFAGEQPAIEDLTRMLAPDAEILDGADDDRGFVRYERDAWLRHLEETSAHRPSAPSGRFFEEVRRTVTDCAPEVRVGSIVEERWTFGADVEVVDTLRCALVVGRVGAQASIVQVKVRRSSRPPPR